MKPKLLLQAEGALVLITACVFYHSIHARWAFFAMLFLAPDLFMFGYLVNSRVGAASYNLAHTYAGPLILLSLGRFLDQSSPVWLSLIWFAHIGLDRMLGYGLKYPSAFKDTHLHKV